jgi:hypothetical protein
MGLETVGLDPAKNPKVRINVTIRDANNSIILNQNIQTPLNLNPGSTIEMPLTNNFTGKSGQITAGATIDPIHSTLGYDIVNGNNQICATFIVAKNYAVKNLKVVPQMHYLEEGVNYFDTPITLEFQITNESKAETGELMSNPIVHVRRNGTLIWNNRLSAIQGRTVAHTITIPLSRYTPGDTIFTVEVNPTREETEFKPGVANPYLDNIGRGTFSLKRYQECIDCDVPNINTDNTWRERFTFAEHLGNVESRKGRDYGDCIDEDPVTGACREREKRDYTYYVCETTSYETWTEDVDYWEIYGIKHVYFLSKWSKDKHGGWIDLKYETGKIKAGYGFELRIVTHYETNRDELPLPNPYQRDSIPRVSKPFGGSRGGGYCDYLTRSPGLSPVDSPNQIYLEMPYVDAGGVNVCYILSRTASSGSWHNVMKSFELPLRRTFGTNMERKIYINEKARVGVYDLSIVTPKWNGYNPNAPVDVSDKKVLHDCLTVQIEIIAQDDLKTHIIQ